MRLSYFSSRVLHNMTQLELPQDILLEIFQYITPTDAAHLSRANRAIRALVMPRALSHVELGYRRIHDYAHDYPWAEGPASHLESFTSLILHNPDACYARHLKSLTLHRTAIVPVACDMAGYAAHVPSLAEVIRSATNLERLDIAMANDLFKFPPLADAITEHAGLRSLRLAFVGPHALSFLPRMKAPLQELALEHLLDPFDFACLRAHTGTLEVLRIKNHTTIRPPPPGETWPALRTLSLLQYKASPPVTSFPPAFPHLERLTLRSVEHETVPMDAGQLRPIAWPSLQVLELSPGCVYVTTRVRALRVDMVQGVLNPPPRFYEPLQPAVLSMDVYHEQYWFRNVQAAARDGRWGLRYMQLRREDGKARLDEETGVWTPRYPFVSRSRPLSHSDRRTIYSPCIEL